MLHCLRASPPSLFVKLFTSGRPGCHSPARSLVKPGDYRERSHHASVFAGGTGVVGRSLIPMLTAAGHQVTATTRTPGKTAQLRSLGAEPVVADALDRAATIEAVTAARPDVIVHQLTGLAGQSDLRHFDRTFAVTNQLRTQGTDYLLEAARAAGTRRFVAQSFTGWPNQPAGGPVKTEDDPFDPHPPASMTQSLRAIQHLEQAVPAGVPEGLVLRYGILYGPGASDDLAGPVRKGGCRSSAGAPASGRSRTSPTPRRRPRPPCCAAHPACTTRLTTSPPRWLNGCRTWPPAWARGHRGGCPPGPGGCWRESRWCT